jgi:parallel beta-helix repeat protein
MMGKPIKSYSGIYVVAYIKSINATIKNNHIYNVAYVGITFAGADISIISNVIDMTCLRLDDCAAIYTYGAVSGRKYNNVNISNNKIRNSIGNMEMKSYKNSESEGIYLDDQSENITIQNNNISNTEHGIYLHNSRYNDIFSNRISNVRDNALWIKEDSQALYSGYIEKNDIQNNIFFSNNYQPVSYISKEGNIDFFNELDNNFYFFNGPSSVIKVEEEGVVSFFSLNEWQEKTRHDLNSIYYDDSDVFNTIILSDISRNKDNCTHSFDIDNSCSIEEIELLNIINQWKLNSNTVKMKNLVDATIKWKSGYFIYNFKFLYYMIKYKIKNN